MLIRSLIDGVTEFCILADLLSSYFYKIVERGVLKSLTIIVDLSIFPSKSFGFYFTHLVALFGACTFRVAMSSCWTDLL